MHTHITHEQEPKETRIDMTLDLFDEWHRQFVRGAIEAKCRRALKAGTAQKLFAIYYCAGHFPFANLLERIRAGFSSPYKLEYRRAGPIAYETLNKEDLRRIYKDEHPLYRGNEGLEAYIRGCMTKPRSLVVH